MNCFLEEQRALLASMEGKEVVRDLLDIINSVEVDENLTRSILASLNGVAFDTLKNIDLVYRAHTRRSEDAVDVINCCMRLLSHKDLYINEGAAFLLADFLGCALMKPHPE
jgi:hypothetical protein